MDFKVKCLKSFPLGLYAQSRNNVNIYGNDCSIFAYIFTESQLPPNPTGNLLPDLHGINRGEA